VSDDLLPVELLFKGVLKDLDEADVAALFSVFIAGAPRTHPAFTPPPPLIRAARVEGWDGDSSVPRPRARRARADSRAHGRRCV
jgi:hypothetical protein